MSLYLYMSKLENDVSNKLCKETTPKEKWNSEKKHWKECACIHKYNSYQKMERNIMKKRN